MDLNLNNLCILVTRPDPQGSELCCLITAHHGRAIHFPTIAFASTPDPETYQQALSALSQQEWIIFISPHAVKSSLPHILNSWPTFPGTTKLAAIGAGTASALNKLGYSVSVYPKTEWNSEALLSLPDFQNVKAKHIAIVRGVGGREKIDSELLARGAHVLPVIAYERIIPALDLTPTLNLIKQNAINAIICTSFESVQHFKILLGEESWDSIRNIPMVVTSERIKILARDLGFSRIWVTLHPSQNAILNALAEIKDQK